MPITRIPVHCINEATRGRIADNIYLDAGSAQIALMEKYTPEQIKEGVVGIDKIQLVTYEDLKVPIKMPENCEACGGSGKLPKEKEVPDPANKKKKISTMVIEPCETCNGEGVVWVEKKAIVIT